MKDLAIFEDLIEKPKKLFLIDGSGALLTALILFFARFEGFFGMPDSILNYLSFTALIYCIYSFCCYFFTGSKTQPYLRLIAIANIIYCSFTITLVFSFYQRLTTPGFIYFLAECLIIIALACIELKIAGSLKS